MAIRWEDSFLPRLARIYGDDVRTADEAMFNIDWRLSRDPHSHTWTIADDSDVRLGWIRSFKGFPAVYFTFRMIVENGHSLPLLLEPRPANDPEFS